MLSWLKGFFARNARVEQDPATLELASKIRGAKSHLSTLTLEASKTIPAFVGWGIAWRDDQLVVEVQIHSVNAMPARTIATNMLVGMLARTGMPLQIHCVPIQTR